MITERTRVVSDRDIRRKSKYANLNDIDIKAGEPFYPIAVNNKPWLKLHTITVPAFAAEWNEYPIDWFTEYTAT